MTQRIDIHTQVAVKCRNTMSKVKYGGKT